MKVLVLGCGAVGTVSALKFAQEPSCEQLVVADAVPGRAQQLADRIGRPHVVALTLNAGDRHAQFRADLKQVAEDPRIAWIDVSAAIDGACYPLTDPVWASGLAQADPERPSPKLVSARFPKLFTPESYARVKRDFSRAHFQYLMAAELSGDYDYFLITAGDRILGDRFRHLASNTSFNRFRLGRA